MTTSHHIPALALALDEFAGELEAMPLEQAMEIVALVRELNELTDPGHLDQVAAAADEALRLAPAVTGSHAPTPRPVPHTKTPGWFRLGALAALSGWYAGTGRVCMHDPTPRRPQPVVAAAWRPGLVVCAACVSLLAVHDPVANATCDRCGCVCAGPEQGDGIRASSLVVGPLTYRVGVCETCYLDWPAEAK